MKFQTGVSKFQFQSFILNFEVSDQSFEVRAHINRFDYNILSVHYLG